MKKLVRHFYRYFRLRPQYAVLFLFFGLILPLSASAQTGSLKKDTAKKLKEVTVSSSLIPRAQAITPSQNISSNEFSHYNAFNVADAIRDFSGVIIKDYGGIGGLKTVAVRGLGAN